MQSLIEQVWDAYWQEEPGGTKTALERAVAVVLAHVTEQITEIASEPPEGGFDSGATRDGWEMACKAMKDRLSPPPSELDSAGDLK